MSEKRVIDLSHTVDASTPPFPGDPAVEITVFDSTDRSQDDGEIHVNASRLAMSLHCGTHIDAPFHFFSDGDTIDQVALERAFGPATIVRVPQAVSSGIIERDDLERSDAEISRTRRVVIDTGWYRRWKRPEFFTEHPVLTEDAARFLVERRVLLVGVDFPSVDREPYPAHHELLGNGVLIVENLTALDEIRSESFELFAVPLRIGGRDGSPVRAFAVESRPPPPR